LFLHDILKVIYAPHKAFKEIVQNPKYIGPATIMILFIIAYTGSAYIAQSKLNDEQTLPVARTQGDMWTENIAQSFWSSNANVSESFDTVSMNKSIETSLEFNYYGNKSIQFSIINSEQIWGQLNFTEPINCYDIEGYKNISFWIKLVSPNIAQVENASLFLFSQTDYFSYNLTRDLTSLNGSVWNKLAIGIGVGSEWLNNSVNAHWGSITGFRFLFTFAENSDITLRLDGFYFKGVFKPFLETVSIEYMLMFSLFAFMQFVIQWVFLAGLIFIMVRAFGGKTLWRPILIAIGFALITVLVQAIINAAVYATLPQLERPLEFFSVIEQERLNSRNKFAEDTWLVSQITGLMPIAILVWTIALCAIATRSPTELSWNKSFLIATVAYFISNIAMGLIL